jgi:predicted GH43/DUF377 family glycosyl hydrolase
MVEKMKKTLKAYYLLFFLGFLMLQCVTKKSENMVDKIEFDEEMVHFEESGKGPVFTGTKNNTWDRNIRERGYILKEDSLFHLWYTGYESDRSDMQLGYATSSDGISWTRYPKNPIYTGGWVEDMSIIKENGVYFMFAEGVGDIAHLLTSTDKINWTEKGNLDIRLVSGGPISKGPYGTPTIWKENNIWYLFYERGDLGIWLATSKDMKIWTNIQDEPVIEMGPDEYDKFAVAINQIVKHKGKYYGYYHASAFKDWREWTINVAVSTDLIHWKKYHKNPILKDNKSSGILVNDGKQYLMYSMHDRVFRHIPKTNSLL